MVSNKQQLKKEAEASVSLSDAAPEPQNEATPEPVPRPKSPFSQSFQELKDAFPDSDESVRRAVLVAASGQLERAFNGMLALTDDTIRPSPPTPVAKDSQIARDEQLARKLAHDYRGSSTRRSGDERRRSSDRGGPRQYSDLEHDNNSWDDFSDNLRQGWTETTKKVSSLFGQLRERIQNEMSDPYEEGEHDLYGVSDRRSSQPRRSPRSEEAPPPPPRPQRPSKPVNAFGEEQASRWQPLQASETSDAFFIGESDSDLESLTGDGDEPTKDKDSKAKDTQPKDKKGPKDKDAQPKDAKDKDAQSKDSKDAESKESKDVKDVKDAKDDAKDADAKPKESKAKELLTQVKEDS